VPVSAPVAYDYFSYVPPVFQDVTPTWGGTRDWLSRFDPDIVIVNGVTAASVMGEPRHREYYQCMAEGSCGYAAVLSSGAVTLYARSDQADALRTRGCREQR
jgi:hypothetical protein